MAKSNDKPIGHCSTVYGDDSTDLIAVYELDDDEKLIQQLVISTRQKIHELWIIPTNERTPAQIGKLAELAAVVEQLNGQCRHRVFSDAGGFTFFERTCVTCGAFMGMV